MCFSTGRNWYNHDHNEGTDYQPLPLLTAVTISCQTSRGITTLLPPSVPLQRRNTGCIFQQESRTAVGQDACDHYSCVVGVPIFWGLLTTGPLVSQRFNMSRTFFKKLLEVLIPIDFCEIQMQFYSSGTSWMSLLAPKFVYTHLPPSDLPKHVLFGFRINLCIGTIYLDSTHTIKKKNTKFI